MEGGGGGEGNKVEGGMDDQPLHILLLVPQPASSLHQRCVHPVTVSPRPLYNIVHCPSLCIIEYCNGRGIKLQEGMSQCDLMMSQCDLMMSQCDLMMSQCDLMMSQCDLMMSQCDLMMSQCDLMMSQCDLMMSQCCPIPNLMMFHSQSTCTHIMDRWYEPFEPVLWT